MANAEMMLICKVINENKLRDVLDWGLGVDDFVSDETRGIFKQLLAVYTNAETSGTTIGPLMARQLFSHLPLLEVDPGITTAFLCKQVRMRRIGLEIMQKSQKAIEFASAGQEIEALSEIQTCLGNVMKLDSGKHVDVDGATGLEMVLKRYADVKSGAVKGVCSWPWHAIEHETAGVQDDDYVVFYGRPKSMKSWVLSYFIYWATMIHAPERRVLVYTKEMTPFTIYQRLAACMLSLPYGNLRRAELSPEQEHRMHEDLRDIIADLRRSNRLIVLSAKDVAGKDTVAWLRSKVDKFGPHLGFVDGLYLMSPDNPKLTKTNERLENVSRAMRQLILDTHVPFMCTLQANRKAAQHDRAELDEIAHSDAIAQDCTAAIRVIKDKHPDGEQTISLVVGGSREWSMAGVKIGGNPALDFSQRGLLSDKDVLKAKQHDDKGDEPEKKSSSKFQKGNKTAKEQNDAVSSLLKAMD